MAKGNMILGYLRGAIGDVVFWRAKGQQMARARNRAPANPRTELQIDVRARWAMLSKFVSIMEPRFLRGAFEGKKVSESDYNVFMRENYSRAQMLSKTASQNTAYPAPGGAWIMSKGSLPVVQQFEEIDDVQLYFPFFQLCTSNSAIAVPSASEQTIAWLSNVLLSVAPAVWRVGDIITFVVVSYDLSQDDGNPVAVPLGTDYKSQFIYKQIVINSNDTTLLSDALGGYFHAKVYSNGTMFGLSYGSNDTDAPAEWAAQSRAATVIHSRNTSSGIKVSSSVLVANGNYALNNSYMFTSDAYRSAVYADWQAAETAILQGSSTGPVVGVTNIYNQKSGTTLTFSALFDAADGSALRLYVEGDNLSSEYLSMWLSSNLTAVTAIDLDVLTEWEYDANTSSWVKAIGEVDYGSGTTASYTIAGRQVTIRKTT